MRMIELQKALKDKGFDPGPVDGIAGRRTSAAIKAFQAANGLVADGVAGPRTLAALAGPAAAAPPANPLQDSAMPWFLEAQRAIGVREDTSAASNPLITGWARRLRISYANDEVPWCGLFVAHCIGLTLPEETLPSNVLGARSWNGFGKPCAVPQPGAVMVFWRESRSSFKGHVGFYMGEDDAAFHILGGNQGDAVNVRRFPRDRFLGARWPTRAPAPIGSPRRLAPDGSFSRTEQ